MANEGIDIDRSDEPDEGGEESVNVNDVELKIYDEDEHGQTAVEDRIERDRGVGRDLGR